MNHDAFLYVAVVKDLDSVVFFDFFSASTDVHNNRFVINFMSPCDIKSFIFVTIPSVLEGSKQYLRIVFVGVA